MRKQFGLICIFICIAVIAHLPWLADGHLFTTSDMIQQQLPFYLDGYEKFHQGELPMWGFNNLLGVNYIGANSFYFVFSPFFLVTLLFPKGLLPFMMLVMNIAKLAFAGITMSWFLQVLKVKNMWLLVIGGLSYAFSGPLIMNYWFNHFNDFLCLVPLFFIAMEWVIMKKRYWTMSIAVAVSAIINVYFCLGLSIISFFYFIWRTGLVAKKQLYFDWYEWIEQIIRYLGVYFVGLLLASFAFLPTVYVLLSNPRINLVSKVTPFQTIITNWLQVWQSIFLVPVTMKVHPFIQFNEFGRLTTWQSFTAAVNPVILLALFQGRRVWPKRIWLITILGVCGIVSLFAIPFTNKLLAGFGNVTYRNLYLLSFFLIVYAVITLSRSKSIHRRTIFLSACTIIGCYVVIVTSGYLQLPLTDSEAVTTFWRVIVWNILPVLAGVIGSALCYYISKKNRSRMFLVGLVSMLAIYQFIYFIYWSGNTIPSFVSDTSIQRIMARTDLYDDLNKQLNTDELLWRYAHDFRSDGSDYFAYNQGLAYQLQTPHIYHSLYQTSTNELFNFLHGIDTPKDAYWQRSWVKSFKYNRLTHWLLGVKYTILPTVQSKNQQPLPTAQYVGEKAIGVIYEYDSQFAKTYGAYIDRAEMETIPWVFRDEIANKVFLGKPQTKQELIHYDIQPLQQKATKQLIQAVNKSKNMKLEKDELHVNTTAMLQIDFMRNEGELYISNLDNMTIYIDGQIYETTNDTAHSMQAKTIAIPIRESVKRVSIQLEAGVYPLWENSKESFQMYFADVDTFDPITIDETDPVYEANHWQQFLRVEDETLVVFPIAYDAGWEVFVDGKQENIQSVQGGLIGVEIPGGEHHLYFKYETPLLKIGIMITVVTSMSMVTVVMTKRRKA